MVSIVMFFNFAAQNQTKGKLSRNSSLVLTIETTSIPQIDPIESPLLTQSSYLKINKTMSTTHIPCTFQH